MRYRACFSILLLLSAAACATATDSPTAPPRLATTSPTDDGEPPPPPLDTGDVEIATDYGGGFSAAGRYFANTQGTNAWIAFVSNDDVVASSNARLRYNSRTGRTVGTGVLSLVAGDGSVRPILDLSQVKITLGTFGSCPTTDAPPTADGEIEAVCGYAEFSVAGRGSYKITVSPRPEEITRGD